MTILRENYTAYKVPNVVCHQFDHFIKATGVL